MTGYHGHHSVVTQLEQRLPPVTLLLGPPSIGKWTMTEHLAKHHGVLSVDTSAHPDGLTADAARTVRAFVWRAALGRLKLVTARLDRSTPAALGVLLKTLEEPPSQSRFLLTVDTWTSRPALPGTITSRAVCHHLGLLPVNDVAAILVEGGMTPVAAGKAARLGGGQVRAARDALAHDDAKETVTTLVDAVVAGDRDRIARASRTFDDTGMRLLHVWLSEALSGRWQTFTKPEIIPPRAWLLHTLASLRRLDRANPRLAVQTIANLP